MLECKLLFVSGAGGVSSRGGRGPGEVAAVPGGWCEGHHDP